MASQEAAKDDISKLGVGFQSTEGASPDIRQGSKFMPKKHKIFFQAWMDVGEAKREEN